MVLLYWHLPLEISSYYRITGWVMLEGTTVGWLKKPFLLSLTALASFNSRWVLTILISFILTVTTSLYSSQVSWHWFHFLCISFLHSNNDGSSLIIHRPLSPWPDFFLTGMQHSWNWRKWSLNINQLSWTSVSCKHHSHGILPRRSLKRLKLALLKFMVRISLPCFLLPHTELHSLMVTTAHHSHLQQGLLFRPFQPKETSLGLLVWDQAGHHLLWDRPLLVSGSSHQGFPGTSWMVCASLCCLSSRYQGS